VSKASVLRALLALVLALGVVGLTASKAGFAVMGGGIGVLVGVPGASVELVRAVLPIVVALLVAVLAIRFGIRTLRTNVTSSDDLARGGRLVAVTAWAAFGWLVVELLYRQLFLGWATLFGNLGASLAWSAVAVALCFAVDRLVPWSRAPRGVRHLGLMVVVAVALLTAQSAWSHREVVSRLALLPVALVGLGLVVSGVRRVESGPEHRMLAELGLASLLLSGPIWSLFS
jgi:hypothetical protein